jgi:two-component system, cell cycle response regulator CpdR
MPTTFQMRQTMFHRNDDGQLLIGATEDHLAQGVDRISKSWQPIATAPAQV